MTAPSLIIEPKAYQSGSLLGYRPSLADPNKVIPVEIPCVRAGDVAMRRNKAGNWVTCPANTPRLHWNVGGTQASWLVEPQATNLVLRSTEFDSVTWAKNRVTVIQNTTTSPDGTQNADTLEINASGLLRCGQIFTGLTAGTRYTLSVYVKAGNVGSVGFLVFNSGETVGSAGSFNLTTKTFSGSTPSYITNRSFTEEGNGWIRMIINATIPAGQSSIKFDVVPISIDGGPIGSNIFVWGAQIETGSIATSPIITAGSAVTRNADVISRTGIADLIGQNTYTYMVEWDNSDKGLCNLLEVYNNASGITGTSTILIQKSAANQINIRAFDSLGNYIDVYYVTYLTGRNKIAFAYEAGVTVVYLNGVLVFTLNRTYVFGSSRDTVSWDNRGAYSRYQIELYKTRLTNAQLAALTTL